MRRRRRFVFPSVIDPEEPVDPGYELLRVKFEGQYQNLQILVSAVYQTVAVKVS